MKTHEQTLKEEIEDTEIQKALIIGYGTEFFLIIVLYLIGGISGFFISVMPLIFMVLSYYFLNKKTPKTEINTEVK